MNFSVLDELARLQGVAAVAYGVNSMTHSISARPSRRDGTPGFAPLLDAGLRKAEIRLLSRRADCDLGPARLRVSRFPPAYAPSDYRAPRAVERGEPALRELGFRHSASGSMTIWRVSKSRPTKCPVPSTQMSATIADRLKALFHLCFSGSGRLPQGLSHETLIPPRGASAKPPREHMARFA